jgi:Flp pilus assembly protein TadG
MNKNIGSFILRAHKDQRLARARLLISDVEGQSLVEMAFAVPILLIVLTGILWFGITLDNYLELANGVGIGGELLSVSRVGYADPCNQAVAAIQNSAPLMNWSATPSPAFTFYLTPPGGNGQKYSWSGSGLIGSGAVCSGVSLTTGEQATVEVQYPSTLQFSIFSMSPLLPIKTPNVTLTVQVTELIQ